MAEDNKISHSLKQYMDLEQKLIEIKNQETIILDQMDIIWKSLTDDEQYYLAITREWDRIGIDNDRF